MTSKLSPKSCVQQCEDFNLESLTHFYQWGEVLNQVKSLRYASRSVFKALIYLLITSILIATAAIFHSFSWLVA